MIFIPCISSKMVLEEDGVHASGCQRWKTKLAKRKERARAKKARALASPVVEGEPAPWVAGHAVLKMRDGEYTIEYKDQ